MENSNRIVKNTIMLYVRMFFTMCIVLYTSRIILQTLGIVNFGLYNVVGGFVAMLGFLNGNLSMATSRFITFEIGKGDEGNLEQIFRSANSIHYIFSAILFILAETIGLWFVINKLVYPADRFVAVMWVYQCSVLTAIISILSAPYNALIIAYERMSAFAYISIFEAISKLLVAFAIVYIDADKLIVYAVLLLLIQVVVRFTYTAYCKREFICFTTKWQWNKDISRRILGYMGWTINGSFAAIGNTQGLNLLLNMFFGPAVNAARGIAYSIQSVVNQFFMNFLTAIRPQIVKSYAQNNLEYMHKLLYCSCKFSFYLILLIAVPLFIHTNYVLHLWLGEVPEYAAQFTRIMILLCMNYALSYPTLTAIHATGDIKKFQLIEASLLLSVIPINYLLLRFSVIEAVGAYVIYAVIEVITQFVRVYIVYPKINLSRRSYFSKILWPITKVMIFVVIVFIPLYHFKVNDFMGFVIHTTICVAVTSLIIFYIGLRRVEKEMLMNKLKVVYNKIKRK